MAIADCSEVALVARFESLLHQWAQELPLKTALEAGAFAAHLKVIAALSPRLSRAAEELCHGRGLFPHLMFDEAPPQVEALLAETRAHLRLEASPGLAEENLRLQELVKAAERDAAFAAEESRGLRVALDKLECRTAGLAQELVGQKLATDGAVKAMQCAGKECSRLQAAADAAAYRAVSAESDARQLRRVGLGTGPLEFEHAGRLDETPLLCQALPDGEDTDALLLEDPAPGRPSLGGGAAGLGGTAAGRCRNISVAVRLRPCMAGTCVDWSYDAGDGVWLKDMRAGDLWRFDRVLGPDTDTPQLFESSGKDVIQSFCEGVNGTILTYGQTASGKTFTMQGDGRGKGVVQLAVDLVFARIGDAKDTKHAVTVSYLEIYNERVYDLLSEGLAEVRMLEDARGDVELQNLLRRRTEDPREVLECLEAGSRRRRMGETLANEHSSRSHTVLQIHLETQKISDGSVRLSQLNLVDLAGSESTKTTGATGKRFREGQNINRSLLALSQVVATLADSAQCPRSPRVGFRDSKLTRILQQSIGGCAQTQLICTISTVEANYWESRRTLDFASRVKRIKNRVSANAFNLTESRPDEMLKLRSENSQLRGQVSQLTLRLDELQALTLQDQGRREPLSDATNRLSVLPTQPGAGWKRASSKGGLIRAAWQV